MWPIIGYRDTDLTSLKIRVDVVNIIYWTLNIMCSYPLLILNIDTYLVIPCKLNNVVNRLIVVTVYAIICV